MACTQVPIQTILGTECIGDSLPKIMGNFNTLGDAACNLITKVNTLSTTKANLSVVDSSTIDLSYNSSTGTLSAITTSFVATSSSPMVARAWVNFNGTGTVAISSSYNVTSITDNGVGNYTINFVSGIMSNSNYIVMGYPMDATQNYRPGVLYEGPSNTKTTSQYQVYVWEPYANALWDSARVQVLIFGGN